MPFPAQVGHTCPRPYRFPFAEAEAAGAAIDALEDENQAAVAALRSAAEGLSESEFAGETATLWRLCVDGFVEYASWGALGLMIERNALDAHIQAARIAEDEREWAIAACVASHPGPNDPQ